jgi:hypothetical protein
MMNYERTWKEEVLVYPNISLQKLTKIMITDFRNETRSRDLQNKKQERQSLNHGVRLKILLIRF